MIMILGGTGLVGSALADALIKAGQSLYLPTRADLISYQDFKEGDEERESIGHFIQDQLLKTTTLINALGIAPGYGDREQRAVYRVQQAVIDEALKLKIPKIISFSALSHAKKVESIPYLHYKALIDNLLLSDAKESGLERYIIKPSLVFAENSPSTRFFKGLTKVLLLGLPSAAQPPKALSDNVGKRTGYCVSPISLIDLVDFTLTLLQFRQAKSVFEVGSENLYMGEYLKRFNPQLKITRIPESAFKIGMLLLKSVYPGVAGGYAFTLLQAGSTPIHNDFHKVMGRSAQIPDIASMFLEGDFQ